MHGRDAVKELWAVVNKDNEVLYSLGGPSSTPKLIVYPTEGKARAALRRAALRNPWIKQVVDEKMVQVVCIYSVPNAPRSAARKRPLHRLVREQK